MSLQQQRLGEFREIVLEHRGVVVRFVRFREENLLEILLPQFLHELVHPVLAARLPEDPLVVHEALHVSDDLKQDDLAAAGHGHTEHESMKIGGRTLRGYVSGGEG